MLMQFIWAGVLLVICAVLHISILIYWTATIDPTERRLGGSLRFKAIVLICGTFLCIIVSHNVQVFLWAGFLYVRGATDSFSQSVYFSLISYTTVGYGDVILDEKHRILGAMSAVAGMLNFGLSTAYLVAIFQYMLSHNVNFRTRVAPWSNQGENQQGGKKPAENQPGEKP